MGVPIVDYKTLNWVQQRTQKSAPQKEKPPARKTTLSAPGVASNAQSIGRPVRLEEPVDVAVQPMDRTLLGVTLALVGIGAVMVYSSSTVIAAAKFDSPTFFMIRQLVRAIVGVFLLVIALRVPLEALRRKAPLLLLVAFALLLVPLAVNIAHRGARSWIHVLGLTFQPSELMKFVLILFLADRLARQQERLSSFANGLLPHLLILGLALGLIVLEPDLGTAVAITFVVGAIMVAARVRSRHLILIALLAAAATTLLILAEPYRVKRLTPGYQIQQGFVAFGSGGVFGRGLGRSLQKFFFLPEPYTDSIFPIIGEELGLLGTLGVLALFSVFGWRGMLIARRQPTLFGFLLAVGLTANVMVYATLNIAVTTGLIPATGLPLPFISYGGSSLVLNLAAAGILLNLSRSYRKEKADSVLRKGIPR